MKTLIKHLLALGAFALGLLSATAHAAGVSSSSGTKPSIVLVHGAFADGSSWQGVVPLLEHEGYTVAVIEQPLKSFADDVVVTQRAIDAQPGPVVLVGHSYGGAVISVAATGSNKVKALVYIAAFAPEPGEALGVMQQGFAPPPLASALVADAKGFLTVDPAKFHDVVAADIPAEIAKLVAANQRPIFSGSFATPMPSAAWKTIPSWYLVATEDRAINPDFERFMAKRIGATTTEVQSSHIPFATHPDVVAGVILQAAQSVSASDGAAIRPFIYQAPQAALDDLHRRIVATNWPERETVADKSQGVQLATMQALANYWATGYDWRKVETRLNSYPQFTTEIDGLVIHFIHVRSKHPHALPVIVTHGWPGSVIEQLKIIDPLTDPTAYGGKPEDAFDVVIPSIPGYGLSGKPTITGWDPQHIARAWVVLMKRLGYSKFVAQGGDWGDAISEQMALLAPPELLAIHTNMPATVPPDISQLISFHGPAPAGLTAEEQHAFDQLDYFFKNGLGYATEMGTRPQTLYGIMDSPVGLAAWFLDHDIRSHEMITRVFAGQSEGLSRDDILDNITFTWLTGTAISSGRLFWESKLAFFDAKHIAIPVAVSVFPDEIYAAPRSWTEHAFPHLIYYNRLAKGGHFAAWEQPEVFSAELRAAFRSLR